jgi:hypothetical protein
MVGDSVTRPFAGGRGLGVQIPKIRQGGAQPVRQSQVNLRSTILEEVGDVGYSRAGPFADLQFSF